HRRKVGPEHLFVSGARPPDRITDQGSFEGRVMHDLLKLAEFRISLPAYAQPDDVFAELIRHFNIQATEQLLSDPELQRLMLPVIRAEFEMATNYVFVREAPWEIPITCFAAKGDPYVSRGHALGWGRFTNSRLQIGALRAFAEHEIEFDVWSLSCIGAWVGLVYHQFEGTPAERTEQTYHFFRKVFRPDDVHAAFPVNAAFAPDLRKSVTSMLEFVTSL